MGFSCHPGVKGGNVSAADSEDGRNVNYEIYLVGRDEGFIEELDVGMSERKESNRAPRTTT